MSAVGPRLGPLAGHLACAWLLCLVWTAAAATVHVGTGPELADAVANPAVARIVVDRPIRLESGDFGPNENEIKLTRNLTVTSDSGGPHQLIDFNARDVRNRISIGADYNLSFVHLTLKDTRYGPGADVDILAGSPDGILYLTDVAKVQTSCPGLVKKRILAYVRDDSVPGTNVITFPNTTVWEGHTYSEPILYKDFSTRMSLGENAADRGYVVHKRGSWKLCTNVTDAACIAALGADVCTKQAQDRADALTHPRQQNPSQQQQQLSTAAKAGIGVAAALVACALLGGALALLRLARRAKQRAAAAAPPLLPTTKPKLPEGGTGGGAGAGAGGGGAGGPGSGRVSWDSYSSPSLPSSSCCSHESGGMLCKVVALPLGAVASSKKAPAGVGAMPSIVRGTLSAEQVADLHLGMLVGAGSFGRVFAGKLGTQDVAIKVVHHDEDSAKQVATEVELMMSFDHPNLVKAHHFVTWGSAGVSQRLTCPEEPELEECAVLRSGLSKATGGSDGSAGSQPGTKGRQLAPRPHRMLETWLVVELCNAGNLQDAVMLREQGVYYDGAIPQIGLLLQTLVGVAQGMEWCHNSGVLHGDLKAANVMMVVQAAPASGPEEGSNSAATGMVELVPKVTDFGMSRMVVDGATHHSTRTIGTITHQAPELMRDGRLSKAADVWSFGVIMWEVVHGAHAWQGKTMGEVITNVLVEGKRLAWGAGTPKAYAALAEECWAADPAGRPTFAQLVLRLQQLMEQHDMLQAEVDAAYGHAVAFLSEEEEEEA